MLIQGVLDKIRDNHEPYIEGKESRDKVLIGDTKQECSGICITICATYDVILEAIKRGANLIITHESIFYGSHVPKEVLEDSPVYQKKVQLIEENHIVIYRDHDRMHGNGLPFNKVRYNPDLIFYGISKELGWDDYIVEDALKPLWFHIPATKVNDLAEFFIDKFHLNGIRTVGSLDFNVSNIWFCEHVIGNSQDATKLRLAEKADVMIPFEIVDYTLSQYVIDSCSIGKPKVIMEMGHFNTEELGMKYMENWLKEFLENIPISFIQSKDLYRYVR